MGAGEAGGGWRGRWRWPATGLMPESTGIEDYGSHRAKSLVNIHSVNALHAYMPTHVCVLSWPYPAELINATNGIQCSTTTCIQPSATMHLQPSEMIEFNAQTMVFLQRHLVLSILNGRQHHLDPVTINSDFEQIHRERQQHRHTPLQLMMSTRA
jgi:hypothetical protein